MNMPTFIRNINVFHHGSTSNQSVEASAIYYAAGAAVISLLVSLVYFEGTVALFGRGSIGTTTLVLATLASFIGYFYAAYKAREKPKKATLLVKSRFILTTAALAFVHAAIVFLVTTIGFYILQNAFVGLMLDQYASSVIVASAVGAMSYAVYLVAAGINTLRISTALAVFLVAGVLTSMITADDPYWWQLHLSSLGAGDSLSAYAFDVTLVVGGLTIVCVADFVANDFAKLQSARDEYKTVKVNGVRTILSLIGVLLACVGLFAYDTNPTIHNVSAGGMAILFMVLIVALPWLVPSFSKAFFMLSYGFMAVLLFCEILFNGRGYLNLTSFEIICFVIVFSWLVIFIRQIAAALADEAPTRILSRKKT